MKRGIDGNGQTRTGARNRPRTRATDLRSAVNGNDLCTVDPCCGMLVAKWEYTQLRFVPRGKSWTGEIEELWLDEQQLISRGRPQQDVTLVGLMNELGSQGWELVTYAQPFTGYHGGCYTFKRETS